MGNSDDAVGQVLGDDGRATRACWLWALLAVWPAAATMNPPVASNRGAGPRRSISNTNGRHDSRNCRRYRIWFNLFVANDYIHNRWLINVLLAVGEGDCIRFNANAREARSRSGLVAPIPTVYQTLASTSSHPPPFTLRRPPLRQSALTTIPHPHSRVCFIDASSCPRLRHSGLPSCAAADRPAEKQPPQQLIPTTTHTHNTATYSVQPPCQASA